MNRRELSKLYYLNKEIVQLQRRLEELEGLATSCTSYITGMPTGHGISDKMAKYAVEISDLKALLDLSLKRCFYELNRLNRYIESVGDPQMRMILSFRYINALSWEQVAACICPKATAESIRKAHERFLSKK